MLVACWSAKGGSGTTVVAAALAAVLARSSSSGAVLVDQGDPGTSCYVILAGVAGVYVRGEYVASSGPGSMVGEIALIDHRPRTATVVADSDLELLQFDSAAFRTLLEEMPKASERVMTLLRARLERAAE